MRTTPAIEYLVCPDTEDRFDVISRIVGSDEEWDWEACFPTAVDAERYVCFLQSEASQMLN